MDSKGHRLGLGVQLPGILVRLDPATGKMTDYKIPVAGAQPYDAWPDKVRQHLDRGSRAQRHREAGSACATDGPLYPMPQPNQSLPKFELAADNTLWFGSRGVPIIAAVHFYPNGIRRTTLPLP